MTPIAPLFILDSGSSIHFVPPALAPNATRHTAPIFVSLPDSTRLEPSTVTTLPLHYVPSVATKAYVLPLLAPRGLISIPQLTSMAVLHISMTILSPSPIKITWSSKVPFILLSAST